MDKTMNPLIPLAANVGSSLFSTFTARRQQKLANKFNLDMWKRNNFYNSPAEQMKRLKDAGLNPNLVYGNSSSGAAGNSSSTPQFESLNELGYRPVDVPSSLESLQSFTDWNIKQATADNLEARTETERQNALLKAAETASKVLLNTKLRTEMPQWQSLSEMSLEALKAQVRKTEADTKYTINQDERAAIQTANNTAEAIERILTHRIGREQTKVAIQNMRYEGTIKKLDAEMAKRGVRPQDPFWYSILERVIMRIQQKLDEPSTQGGSWWKKLMPF